MGLCGRSRLSLALAGAILALALSARAPAAFALAPPTAFTGGASEVTLSTATLRGSVYPGDQSTSYFFQYGPTAAYGSETASMVLPAGRQSLHVAGSIGPLAPGSVYHFRLVAVNASGVADGQDRALTTKAVPLSFTAIASLEVRYLTPVTISGVLSGTGSAARQLILQASPFPYVSAFANVAGPVIASATGAFVFTLPGLVQSTHLRIATLTAPHVTSRILPVLVAVRVALHARAAGRAGFVRLYGTVTPAQSTGLVRLQVLAHGHTPRTLATVPLRQAHDGISRFSRIIRLRHPGLFRAAAVLPAGPQVSAPSREIEVG